MKQNMLLVTVLLLLIVRTQTAAQQPVLDIQVGINANLKQQSDFLPMTGNQQFSVAIPNANPAQLWVDKSAFTNDPNGYIMIGSWNDGLTTQIQGYSVQRGGMAEFMLELPYTSMPWSARYEPNVLPGGSIVWADQAGELNLLDTNWVRRSTTAYLGGINPHTSSFSNDSILLYSTEGESDSFGGIYPYKNQPFYERNINHPDIYNLVYSPTNIPVENTDFLYGWGSPLPNENDVQHANSGEKIEIGANYLYLFNYRQFGMVFLSSLGDTLVLGGSDNLANQFTWTNTPSEIDYYGLYRLDGHAGHIAHWDVNTNKVLVIFFKNGGITTLESSIHYYEVDLNNKTVALVKRLHFTNFSFNQALGNAYLINVPPIAVRTKAEALNGTLVYANAGWMLPYADTNGNILHNPAFGILKGDGTLIAAGYWDIHKYPELKWATTYQAHYMQMPFMEKHRPKLECTTDVNGKYVVKYPENLVTDASLTNWRNGEQIGEDLPVNLNNSGSFMIAGMSNLLPTKAEHLITISQQLVLTPDNIESVCNKVLAVADISELGISIYPNPTAGLLSIAANEMIQQIDLFDMSGQLVLSTPGKQLQKTAIDLTAYAKGTYVLKVLTPTGVFTKKVTVQE